MSDIRFNTIYYVIGARGSGKTPLITGGDEEEGLAKIYLRKNMSTLIIDTHDHPKYRGAVTLHPKDYKMLETHPGIYRTITAIDHIPALMKEVQKVWNTFIVFEDCYKYMANTLPKVIKSIIGESKQQNNELLFMTACWAWTVPDVVRITNYYVIFKTADNPEVRKTELGGCFSQAMKAHEIVMAKKKRYITLDSGV